ncbi:MAG: STM3941 family protein [Methylophilus sp.]|nr:STM3941 family protein [Methylophilus sp.]
MSASEQTIIALSKNKIWMLIIGSIAFVAMGFWMISMDATELALHSAKYRNPLFIHGVGYACILFFGLGIFVGIRKLFDNNPGLVIDAQGILDNVSRFSPQPVPWRDIQGFGVAEIHKQKMLVIFLENPQHYLDNATSMQKIGFTSNAKLVGSPWVITASTLKTNFDELLNLCQQALKQYKR